MERPQAKAMLTVVAGLYGLDYSIAKLLQERMPPEVVSCIKYGLAALYFLPQLARETVSRRDARVGLELGAWCTVYAVSVANAIHTTQASKVSFISSVAIILPPVYDMTADLLRGARGPSGIDAHHKVGVLGWVRGILASPFIAPLLAMKGVHMIASPAFSAGTGGGEGGGAARTPVWRDAMLLVSPVASSLCYWRSQRLSEERPYSPTAATAVMLGTVAVLTLVVSVWKYGVPVLQLKEVAGGLVQAVQEGSGGGGGGGLSCWDGLLQTVAAQLPSAGMVAVSSLLVTGWNTVTEQRALRVVSAAEAYLVLSLEPFFATLFAALLLGERVSRSTVYAALFIVAASLWRHVATWLQESIEREETRNHLIEHHVEALH